MTDDPFNRDRVTMTLLIDVPGSDEQRVFTISAYTADIDVAVQPEADISMDGPLRVLPYIPMLGRANVTFTIRDAQFTEERRPREEASHERP